MELEGAFRIWHGKLLDSLLFRRHVAKDLRLWKREKAVEEIKDSAIVEWSGEGLQGGREERNHSS